MTLAHALHPHDSSYDLNPKPPVRLTTRVLLMISADAARDDGASKLLVWATPPT